MVAATQEPFSSLEVERVPEAAWRLLFADIGCPPGVSSESLTHEAILDARDALASNRLFLSALQMLDELGTDEGQEALRDSASDQAFPLDAWPQGEGAYELAMRFYIAHRHAADAEAVVARARVRLVERGRQRSSHEYAGKTARSINDRYRETKIPKFEEELREFFVGEDLGEHVEVQSFMEDGELHVHVIRGGNVQKPVTIQDNRRRILEFRPAQQDLLRYEPETGRVRISTRAMRLVRVLRTAFGRAFFDDPAFFSDAETCTLLPLLKEGRATFKRVRGSRVLDVSVRHFTVRRGDLGQIRFKDVDLFDVLDHQRNLLADGELIEARLVMRVAGERKRAFVNVKVPNRVDFDRKFYGDDVDAILEAAGIRTTGAADPQDFDLWSLAPWRHTADVWRRVLTGQFDEFVKTGLLTNIELNQIAHPDFPAHGAVLSVRSVDEAGSEIYGVTNDDVVPSRTLTPSDIEGLELNLLAFAQRVAGELELTGDLTVLHGFVDLGERSLGNTRIRVFLMTGDVGGPHMSAFMFAAARGAQIVVLHPAGRSSGMDWLSVGFQGLSRPFAPLKDEIVDKLGIRDALPARDRMPPGTRLLIDRQRAQVWFDDMLLDIESDSQAFKLAEVMGKSEGKLVRTKELRAIAPASTNPHRKAKMRILESLRKTHEKAGKAVPGDDDVIASTSKGYLCVVPAFVG